MVLGPSSEVIVIDNASADGSVEMVQREFPDVHLIVNEGNLGFARANNRGIAASRGRYVLLLNSDTVASPAALEMLVAFMDAHPEAGVVGPRLLRPDGTAQPYAFGGDPTLGYLLRRGFNRLLRGRYLHDWDTERDPGGRLGLRRVPDGPSRGDRAGRTARRIDIHVFRGQRVVPAHP